MYIKDKQSQFKFIQSRNVFLIALLIGIVWCVTFFSQYGIYLFPRVPSNFVPVIHAMMFFGMLLGFFMSLVLWVEESLNSKKS